MTDKVIQGDALEIVADLGEFDYIMTDPPYSVNPIYHWNDKGLSNANMMNSSMQRSLVAGVIRNIQKKDNFAAWIFTDWINVSFVGHALLAMGLDKQSCIVWDKDKPFYTDHYHKMHEMVVFAKNFVNKDKSKYYGRDIIKVKSLHSTKKNHLHSKPVELAEKLLHNVPPGRILDPFCGGGNLLKGAQNMGFEVVGIDAVEEFVKDANKNLEDSAFFSKS